jgi:hypothetical protein
MAAPTYPRMPRARRPWRLLSLAVGAGLLSAQAVAGPAPVPVSPPAPAPIQAVAALTADEGVVPDEDRGCSAGAIADIRLPAVTQVDEIVVILRDGSPLDGAAELRVDAGAFDRVMHIRDTSKTLSFTPALSSSELRITLEPVLSQPSACVDRIELRQAGVAVATVVP